MRYSPPGMCLNDFAVIENGPAYHLLHLQGPWTPRFDEKAMETSYGRATSTDLVSWATDAPCFGVGEPGRFDSSAVWTMHPFPHAGGTAMAYTGVAARPWAEQAIGLAYSDRTDGTGWRRVRSDAVVRADERWYRTGEGMAWRDPFVVADGEGGWAMVLCASSADRPLERSGCVGFARSSDLVNWEVLPPVLVPGGVHELECPVLERTPGGWVLLGSIGEEHRVHSWSAQRLEGPWTHQGALAPPGPYAPRVVNGPDGTRLLLHTVQRRTGLSDDGTPCRGMLAQPKVLDVSGEAPVLRWWSALDACFGAAVDRSPEACVIDVPADRPGSLALREPGRSAGLTLYFNDAGAVLRRVGDTTLPHLWAHRPKTLRVLVIGEFVEVYADDVLVLNAADYGNRPEVFELGSAAGRQVVPVRPLLGQHIDDRDDVSAIGSGPLPASWPFPGVPAASR